MASQLNSSGYCKGPNGNLFFEREGNSNGQSILFVHGLGGTTNAFQPLLSDLQAYDLVRFDWAGHGRSAVPETASIDSYVEDCEAILRHLNLQPVIVVGHSLGGLISLHLAAKDPGKVKSLVLFGPVSPPPEAGQKALAGRAEAVREDGMASVADTIVSNAFAANSFSRRKAEVALAREMLTRQNPEGYALAVEALKNSTSPQWDRVTAPVVILSGEEDKVSTVTAGETMVTKLGGHAKQQRLAEVGHWHMLEAPAQCIESIKQASQ